MMVELKSHYLKELKQMKEYRNMKMRPLVHKAIFFATYWDTAIWDAEKIKELCLTSSYKEYFLKFFEIAEPRQIEIDSKNEFSNIMHD